MYVNKKVINIFIGRRYAEGVIYIYSVYIYQAINIYINNYNYIKNYLIEE